jgi:transcriptional regulator with XRE-family HTH domain
LLPERLKSLREEHGYTQQQVAQGVNLVYTQYQFYEYGTKKPGYEKLIAFAGFYDVSVDYLLGLTDNPQVNK